MSKANQSARREINKVEPDGRPRDALGDLTGLKPGQVLPEDAVTDYHPKNGAGSDYKGSQEKNPNPFPKRNL